MTNHWLNYAKKKRQAILDGIKILLNSNKNTCRPIDEIEELVRSHFSQHRVNYPAAKDGGASVPTNSPSKMGLTSGRTAISSVPEVLCFNPSLRIIKCDVSHERDGDDCILTVVVHEKNGKETIYDGPIEGYYRYLRQTGSQ